jgi:hypothetical protein
VAQVAPLPSTGIDRTTGQVLVGWQHVEQSLRVIFTTHFGERVMRRWFGSAVPALLGRNMTNPTILRFWTAIIVAIDAWEPRFRVTRIQPVGSAAGMSTGQIGFAIAGVYYPNALTGDYSVSTPKTITFGNLYAADLPLTNFG